uniref:Aldo-keto reductase family 1, member A1a (aldehyde reductase) n=1 Tax=Sinocyclocheilus grahami TaxID=75366 RepID=A0A672T0T4_SINGR
MTATVTLSTGQQMSAVGLGTWKSAPGQVKQPVLAALDCGYRHIDCVAVYSNEREVGQALSERFGEGKPLRREDIFVTSKLWNTKHHPDDVEEACKKSLSDLRLSYLDLYLMHSPAAMEKLVDQGLVKAIGLSNFNARQTDDILCFAKHKPVVNQVECHPYLVQTQLVSHCWSRGLVVTAYSPLGSPDHPWVTPGEAHLLDDPRVVSLAKRYNKTPAQVVIRWHIQRGVVCIPKSVTPSRIKQNIEVFDFKLSDEDMKVIESFNKNERLIIPTIMKDGQKVWRDAKHPHFPFSDSY